MLLIFTGLPLSIAGEETMEREAVDCRYSSGAERPEHAAPWRSHPLPNDDVFSPLLADPKQPRFIETVHRRGYRFIAVVDEGSDQAAIEAPAAAPAIVGRDAELRRLREVLAASAGGQRRTLFVTGEAGIGKTTLLEELVEEIPAGPQRILIGRGQCIEQRRDAEPYLPVLEALQSLSQADSEVVELLKRFAPTWLVRMPWLLSPAELQNLQVQLMGAGPERMLREFTTALTEIARYTPLLIVLEDLHWSDAATIDLLAALARRRDPVPLMLLGSLRRGSAGGARLPIEELLPGLTTRHDAEELALGRLDDEASRACVARRLGGEAPAELIAAIDRHSGGSPLFLVTAVNHAVEQGWVVSREGHWQLTITGAALDAAIPDGLRQLIEVQATAMASEDRALLEVASVVGTELTVNVLAILLGQTVTEVETALMRIVARHRCLRRTAAGSFELTHALHQQVLYESIEPARRRQLHLEVARALAVDRGDRAGECAAELARHCERGGDYQAAARHLATAALNARARVAETEAAALLEHALRLISQVEASPQRQRREADLWIQLGAVRGSLFGRGAELYIVPFNRAWELSVELDDVPRMFLSRMASFGYLCVTEQFRRAEEVCHDLLRLADRLPMPDMLAVAHAAMGSVLLGIGRLRESREHLEKALATLNPYDPSTQLFRRLEDPEILCLTGLAWALAQLGYPDQARQRCALALELGRSRAPYHHVYCLNAAATLAVFLDEADACLEYAEATLALAQEHGFDAFLPNATLLACWARERLSGAAGAGERLAQALEAYRRSTQRFGMLPYLALLAETHLNGGEIAAGLAVVTAAEARMESSGERASEGNLLRIKALLLDRAGRDREEVERCFELALGAARRNEARLSELRVAVSYAGWLANHSTERARETLAPVYQWFGEGLDTPDVLRARRLLQDLR